MRPTELRTFSENELDHIEVVPDFIQQYSFMQDWSDIPFPYARKIWYQTNEYFVQSSDIDPVRTDQDGWITFETDLDPDSNWTDFLIQCDEFLSRIGDRHHTLLTTIESDGEVVNLQLDS